MQFRSVWCRWSRSRYRIFVYYLGCMHFILLFYFLFFIVFLMCTVVRTSCYINNKTNLVIAWCLMRSFGLFDLPCRKHSRTWLPRIIAMCNSYIYTIISRTKPRHNERSRCQNRRQDSAACLRRFRGSYATRHVFNFRPKSDAFMNAICTSGYLFVIGTAGDAK